MKFLKVLFLFCFLLSGCKSTEKEVNSSLTKVVLIDPGHGGNDNGAVVNGVVEDSINLNVSLYLYEMLLKEGFIAFITRTGDYDLSSLNSNNHKAQDLNKRVKMINDNKVDFFVSLHLNAFLDSSVRGAQVFYQQGNEKSEKSANILQMELNKLYEKQRNSKAGEFYLLEESKSTGVLIEMGFLSSPLDREKLTDKQFQQRLAKTIFDCLILFL